jgi:uncharacterized circularly permuted ATP-grasp superfamily protein/uncharacterized alpha-E superfamily protein
MSTEDRIDGPAVSHFLQHCTAPPGVFDELRGVDGSLRHPWRRLIERLGPFDRDEYQRRTDQAQRLLYDHGVAHEVHPDASRYPRPWELDGLPLPIPAVEWREVNEGVAQRARLLNFVAADLYGSQSLIRDGVLPPELVFGNPGFLRPCHGQSPPEGHWIHLYAADVARGPDGRWSILADRTEAPSGAGYALENRIVTSRVLAEVVHDCQVERLAAFFLSLRETLRRAARRRRDNPRIALLTPGPGSATYFEDAYLARYLEFTLVEGADLAVRDGKVQIKTLGGLMPVDVVLHRIDDADCDPLELHGGSKLGVPGLLDVARRGNVTVANTLGSGMVEAPALSAYLPQLCRKILGQDLKIPTAKTYWCGDPASCDHVLNNLDSLVIKPAFRRGRVESILGRPDGPLLQEELADAIRARPALFVGQERVACSAAPSWVGGALRPAHLSLRTYAAATADGYHVMPGGLMRISFQPYMQENSLAWGEGSKDCWVLAEGPVHQFSLLPRAGAPIELRRSGVELPSRVAENLFWLGRHVERAESAARLLRTVVSRLTSESASAALPELPILIRGLAEQGQIEPGFAIEGIRTPLPSLEKMLPVAVFDVNEARSLRRILSKMHLTASNVRDRLSIDGWRILHRIDQSFQPPTNRNIALAEVHAMLNQVILDLSAFSGLVADSMTRTHGWRFLEIGRRIERASQTLSMVSNTLLNSTENESAILDALLEVADSRMTYRSRYLANLNTAAVLDLLLTDETNPRAVAFQLVALAEHVENLPRDRSQPQRGSSEKLAMACLNTIRMTTVRRLVQADYNGYRTTLERLLMRLTFKLPQLSNAIVHKYLMHTGPARQLSEVRAEAKRR